MEKVFNAPKSQSIITNTNTKILLSQFVITKVQETELKDKIPSAKLIEDLLIEELNKKSIAPNDHFPDSNTRNLDVRIYLYCLTLTTTIDYNVCTGSPQGILPL